MKRDMDLVRDLLLITEEAESSFDPRCNYGLEKYSETLIVYHVELLESQGLIDCQVAHAMGGVCTVCEIQALTWDGADYLDAIRDLGVWGKTKKVIKDTVKSTTMKAIKEIAVMVAVNMAAQKIGM